MIRACAILLLLLGLLGAPAARGWEIREIELPTPLAGPSIVAVGPDQSIWVSLARAGKLLRRTPDGRHREYPLPAGSFPVGLLVEPEGDVWFSDIRRNQVVRLDPASGDLRGFAVPTADSWPFFLARDAAGNLYFTQRVGNKIGRLDPRTGAIEEVPLLTPHAQPAGMTITPDGHLFFTQNSANKIGHLDLATGRLRDLPVPSPSTPGPHYGPAGITSDREGNVWFAELDGRLGLIRREDRERIVEVALPNPRVRPGGLAVDSWGLVWYTGLDGNMIGSYDPAHGVFRSYPIPSGSPDSRPMSPPEVSARGELPKPGLQAKSTRPFGIAIDGQGRVWFSEQYGHRLGVVEPPTIDVVSPAGALAAPAVEIRTARRNLREGWRLRYLLDGQPFAAADRLDLTRLTPGRHRWEAVAEGPGGPPVRSEAEIVVLPGLDLVEQAVAGFLADGQPPAELSRAIGQEMRRVREQVRQGRADLARQALRAVLRSLDDPRLAPPVRLIHQIRYLDLFGRLEPEVAVGEAGCSPASIVVEVGDAVRWRHAAPGAIRLAATDGSFSSPEISSGSWSRVFDQEGKIEYLCGISRGTLSVEPRKADVRETAMRGPGRVPTVLAIDEDQSVWFSAGGGGYASLAAVPVNNIVGRLRPTGEIEEFRTPTPESAPTSIKIAPDGTIWFTERAANKIGRLDPATGTITELEVPTERSAPTGIAVAPDGSVWFTEKMASKIGRFDPVSRTFREYPTPTPRAEPSTVVVDAEGHVWFDERGADTLNRMDPKTGEVTVFKVPTQGSRVIGLVPDPRGYMWFLELAGHKVGRLEVATGQIVEYTIPTKLASPFKAALDRHGRLWFTQAYGNKIGVLQGERFFELALPREASMPGGIEITREGHVWFTQQAADVIGYLPFAAEIFSPPDSGLVEEARPEG